MANPYLPVSIATSQQSLAAFGHPPTLHDMSSTFSSGGIGQRQQQPRQQDQNQSGHRPIDSFHYTAHQDQTTLVLGVMNYLERLEGEIAEMKEFINLGFKRIETIGQEEGGIAASIEDMRLQNRNWNRAHVTELDENFRLLPRLTGEYPTDIPTTGEVLKEASHKVIDHILDQYDIPFVPTMFLVEKKMLYLRFLGANRVVMHRILD